MSRRMRSGDIVEIFRGKRIDERGRAVQRWNLLLRRKRNQDPVYGCVLPALLPLAKSRGAARLSLQRSHARSFDWPGIVYSVLSAVRGSTRDARRAGIALAMTATPDTMNAASR